MDINNKQALYVTSYLYKGIYEMKYRNISISISENAVIGFEKKGSRYKIYVRVNNKFDKSARGAVFTIPVEDIYELAEFVKQAIENSNMLENMTLDMSKVPDPSIELIRECEQKLAAETDNTEDFEDVEPEPDPEPEEYVDDAEELIAPEAFRSDIPITPKNESDHISLEAIESEFNQEMPDIDENADKKQNADQELFDEMPDEPVAEEKPEDIPYEAPKDPFPYNDAVAFETANDTATSMLQEYDEKHAQPLDLIRKNSYINSIMRDNFDFTEDTEKMFRKLVEIRTDKATDIYINLVCHLISEFDYDIVRMSEETGVDRRNIMLAMMEKQFN